MNSQLTPAQALLVLDKIVSEYKGTRQEHLYLQQAVQTLVALVQPPQVEVEGQDDG